MLPSQHGDLTATDDGGDGRVDGLYRLRLKERDDDDGVGRCCRLWVRGRGGGVGGIVSSGNLWRWAARRVREVLVVYSVRGTSELFFLSVMWIDGACALC